MIGELLMLSLLPIFMLSSLLYAARGSPASVVDCRPIPESSNCSLQSLNISFPFSGPGQAQRCGLPDYHLSCSGGQPTIQFGTRNYSVKAIDYARHYIFVAEMDNALRDGCSWQLGNTALDQSQFDLEFGNEKLVLFRCPTAMPAPCHGSITGVNCSGDTDGRGVSWYYYIEREMERASDGLLGSCNPPVVVPLRSEAVLHLMLAPPTVERLKAALSQGFAVQWKAQYEWCTSCFNPSETCGSSSETCYGSNSTHLWSCSSESQGSSVKWRRKLVIACGALLAGFLSRIIIALLYTRRNRFWFWQNKQKPSQASVDDFLVEQGPLALTRYSYKQVKQMTNSFDTKLGHGGYGSVFRGNLTKSNALIPVAVKVMGESKGSGEDFINEVASIGRTNHVNIVSHLGFCSDGSKRALIYEFMPMVRWKSISSLITRT